MIDVDNIRHDMSGKYDKEFMGVWDDIEYLEFFNADWGDSHGLTAVFQKADDGHYRSFILMGGVWFKYTVVSIYPLVQDYLNRERY